MSLGKPKMPNNVQQTPPLRVEPEAEKAKIDMEERMRKATMSRAKSRLTLPYLKDIVQQNKMVMSDKL